MPEGPEIKRAGDKLARLLVDKTALLVEFRFPHLAHAAQRLTGQRILGVAPRGKALLTSFAHGETLYTHNQLYGEWQILPHGKAPHPSKQVRAAIHVSLGVAVLYSASDIEVIATSAVSSHPYLARLGTELLDKKTTREDVRLRVNAARFQNKSLAALLLDQGFLAGVGNYLRSEILFVARMSPLARLCALSPTARNALADAAFGLTWQSYRTKGITNDLAIARAMKSAGMHFGAYRHWVFDRAGEPCHVCGTRIARQDLSGRGLYWCPSCQANKP